MPSDRKAENPGIRKEENKFRLDSWIQKKVNGMRRNKVLQFSAPGLETPSIQLKSPERVKEGKRKQEVKRNSQEHEAVVRVQREKIQSGRKKEKRFEDEGGVRVLH